MHGFKRQERDLRMSSNTQSQTTEEINAAIYIDNISKCYQIYSTPRDRLKQFLLPPLIQTLPAIGRLFAGNENAKAPSFYKEFWALREVSFEVKKGETIGIIGHNGSGKSTLLQIICGTLSPTTGNVRTHGRVAALLELGSGFNPEFTGRENVYMNAAVLGLRRSEVDDRFNDIATFADIGDFIEQPVKTYSSGMMVRLAFSVAIHVDPEILIVDEALSVGDAYFQAKCARMIQTIIQRGATVLFVSHDTASIKSLCDRAILLNAGRIEYIGDVNTAVEKYYTALISKQSTHNESQFTPSHPKSKLVEQASDNHKFLTMASFQRIQNGWAEFLNVSLMDSFGNSIETVSFGEKVTLRQAIKFNQGMEKLALAYHIRDKNGQDIVYSDTGIEQDSHIVSPAVGSIHLVDWTFTVRLREGEYVVSSMASEPVSSRAGDVVVVDFIPISLRFSVSRGNHPPIYGATYWENELHFQEISNAE
jgi:lipopolysaccharide transport system ATP-binding protein